MSATLRRPPVTPLRRAKVSSADEKGSLRDLLLSAKVFRHRQESPLYYALTSPPGRATLKESAISAPKGFTREIISATIAATRGAGTKE